MVQSIVCRTSGPGQFPVVSVRPPFLSVVVTPIGQSESVAIYS